MNIIIWVYIYRQLIFLTFYVVLWVNNRFSILRQLQNKEDNQREEHYWVGDFKLKKSYWVITHFCLENIVQHSIA